MKPLAVLDVPLAGTHLIEASAGTGKTYTIATLVLRLVLESELGVERILVVTYTRAATAELRTRVRRRLREALATLDGAPTEDAALVELLARRSATLDRDRARLEQAIADFDQAAVLTIHGFCQRVLHENAFESGAAYDTELVADLAPLVRELVQDFWIRRLVDAPPAVAAYAYGALKLEGNTGLTGLVYRILSQPEIQVLPKTAPTLEAAIEQWENARLRCLDAYDADVAAAALAPRKDLRQAWLEQLVRLLSSPVPGFQFTESGVNKKQFPKLCKDTHPFLRACTELWDAHQLLLQARAGLAAELVAYAREELGRRKSTRGVRSYDDLLLQVRAGLEAGPGLGDRLRDRYRVALIDEFQDTDKVQYEIFKQAFHDAGRPLFLIGDPKQAIYGFRGGDVFTYLTAREDAEDRQWTLDVSWRSDPGLVRGLNTFFQGPAAPFVVPEIAYQAVRAAPRAQDRLQHAGAPLTLLTWARDDGPNAKRIPERIAAHLCGLLARGAMIGDRPLGAGDVAMLSRTNKQSLELQQALRAVGVPSVLLGDDSVLDSAEAEELERLLAAAADPSNRGALRAAITTSFYGESGDQLLAAAEAPERWAAWRDDFRDWNLQWHDHGFMPAFRQAVESRGVPERLLGLPDGERRLTNLFHLAELLHAAEREGHLGPEGLVYWLREMRGDSQARGDVAPEAMQVRLENDALAVKLLTIHKSKGLEYPVVYCPYLCGEALLRPADQAWLRFHDDDRRAVLDLRGSQDAAHLAQARYEASAEQARLLYVALTRAKHACYVVWGQFKQASESGLALALHGAIPVGGDPVAAHEQARTRLEAAFKADPSGDLHDLVARSGGAIAIEPLVASTGARWPAPPAVERPLAARGLPPMPPVLRKSSFSEMTQHATPHRAPSIPVEVGLDVDAAPLELDGMPAPTGGRLTLADLPSGARTGTLLHAVLEEVDFAREKRGEARAVVEKLVARFGYDAKWVDPITRSLDDVLDTPIGEVTSRPGKGRGRSGWTLADVPPGKRLAELEFFLPVAQEGTALTAARLSRALTEHGGLLWAPYAARVRALRFEALAGYLQGFIDLVFEEDGRYWVVDYKSNRLGSRPDDYRVERLEQSMQDSHYVLQYLLYLVAVHRHLRTRLPKYSAAKQLGGALYLFMRGMSPSRGMNTGVYFARPPVALIEALDRVLEGRP